ncbi:hypothetical protein J6590_068519 [Homalodisca vitripennis]|nr:hypothetical protein J6590_068519 [Homalodisca vitripennis]
MTGTCMYCKQFAALDPVFPPRRESAVRRWFMADKGILTYPSCSLCGAIQYNICQLLQNYGTATKLARSPTDVGKVDTNALTAQICNVLLAL